MFKEVQTQAGRCSTHGTVEATREVPKMGFPFVVYAIWRAVAQRRPFLCPECGAAVQADGRVRGRCAHQSWRVSMNTGNCRVVFACAAPRSGDPAAGFGHSATSFG